MATNKKDFIRSLALSKRIPVDLRISIWYNLMATKDIKEYVKTNGKSQNREEVEKNLQKICKYFGFPLEPFQNILRSLESSAEIPIQLAKESIPAPEPIHPNTSPINSPEIKVIIEKWISLFDSPLTISEKLELSMLCSSNIPQEIMERMEKFSIYQIHFKGVTNVDRMTAYLFRNSFRSFLNNFHKFGSTFEEIFAEHKARYMAFKNKPVSYGFSSDPIEDRRLAEEAELQSICFALETGSKYSLPVVFPENMKYLEKKMKAITKKETARRGG